MIFRVGLLAALSSALVACSTVSSVGSLVGLGKAEDPPFRLVTNPAGAACELRGQDGFASNVQSPAEVKLPASAGPIAVRCVAAGHRTVFATLQKDGKSWSWTSAGPVLALEQDRPRDLKIIERTAGQPLRARPTW